jgi:chromosome segregation ATPase
MTERELSRLKRPELIERLIKQDRVNSKLKTKIERMERRSAEHLDQIDELKRTLERLKKKLDAKDAEMESTFNRLKKKLDAKDAEMESTFNRLKKKLDAKDAEMESTFNRLKKKLDAKDAELDRVNDQLEETYKRLAHKLDMKDSRIRELKTVLMQRSAAVDPLTAALYGSSETDEYDTESEGKKISAVKVKKKSTPVKPKSKSVKRNGKR